jgi:membrane-associated HD superfamily phosphohydrolase
VDDAPSSLTEPFLRYGVLGIAVLVFAVVIVRLFKEYKESVAALESGRVTMEKERATWAVERERLRAESDTRYHDVIKDYAQKLVDEHKLCREREDALHRENNALIEEMAEAQNKSSSELIEMLEKLQDRFVFKRGG